MKPGDIPVGWKRGQPIKIEHQGRYLMIWQDIESTTYDPNARIDPNAIGCIKFFRHNMPTDWLVWWFL